MRTEDDIRRRVASADISSFRKKVYLALLEVPRGKTITYGELGRRIGCRSAQAIGQALRRNPFAQDLIFDTAGFAPALGRKAPQAKYPA